MALKPGPPVQAKVTVSKKGTPKLGQVLYGQDFPVPEGYELVDVTNLKYVETNGAYDLDGKPLQSLKFQHTMITCLETAEGAAPSNVRGKGFFLSSMFEWRLISYGGCQILVPLNKLPKKKAW